MRDDSYIWTFLNVFLVADETRLTRVYIVAYEYYLPDLFVSSQVRTLLLQQIPLATTRSLQRPLLLAIHLAFNLSNSLPKKVAKFILL